MTISRVAEVAVERVPAVPRRAHESADSYRRRSTVCRPAIPGLSFRSSCGRLVPALVSLVVMVVSMALQGRGHRIEAVPPEPFTSAGNAVARIFLEQWVTFPRFVVSGGWIRALRDAS